MCVDSLSLNCATDISFFRNGPASKPKDKQVAIRQRFHREMKQPNMAVTILTAQCLSLSRSFVLNIGIFIMVADEDLVNTSRMSRNSPN